MKQGSLFSQDTAARQSYIGSYVRQLATVGSVCMYGVGVAWCLAIVPSVEAQSTANTSSRPILLDLPREQRIEALTTEYLEHVSQAILLADSSALSQLIPASAVRGDERAAAAGRGCGSLAEILMLLRNSPSALAQDDFPVPNIWVRENVVEVRGSGDSLVIAEINLIDSGASTGNRPNARFVFRENEGSLEPVLIVGVIGGLCSLAIREHSRRLQ